jgi:galactose mutarotase-like enzyme
MTVEPITIASDWVKATILPHGAELIRLTFDGKTELLWNGDPAVWKGRAPILFPVIGMMRDGHYRHASQIYAMPKHGFARDALFEVMSCDGRAVLLRLSATEKTMAAYPFTFQLELHFSVAGRSLTIEARIANLGDGPMPASFGFHPAFRWPLPGNVTRAQHSITFEHPEPNDIRRIGADGLLIERSSATPVRGRDLPLADDLFVNDAVIFDQLTSRSVTYGGNSGPRLRVDFPDLPILGVWTKPGAKFICIEPWQGLPDPTVSTGEIADKPGIVLIEPRRARKFRMSITVLD